MTDAAAILEADGLRVVFFRQGDRYAHRIEVFDAAHAAWNAVLESLEGKPDDDWPPSPPFQQLHIERRANGSVILLVGMAGRTHWSAAVEVADDRNGIKFDVAARIQRKSPVLGTQYAELEPPTNVSLRTPTTSVSSIPWRVAPTALLDPPSTITWRYVVTRRVEA